MSKEKLIWQIEQLQNELYHKNERALKYYSAYSFLMDNFNDLPDDIKPQLDKRLKAIGL